MKFGVIGFEHYKIHCVIGNNVQERLLPQDIYLDLRVEQDFSLWRQQRRIEPLVGFQAFDIVGDQPLQEQAGFRSGDGDDRTVFEMSDGHGYDVVRAASVAKTIAAS